LIVALKDRETERTNLQQELRAVERAFPQRTNRLQEGRTRVAGEAGKLEGTSASADSTGASGAQEADHRADHVHRAMRREVEVLRIHRQDRPWANYQRVSVCRYGGVPKGKPHYLDPGLPDQDRGCVGASEWSSREMPVEATTIYYPHIVRCAVVRLRYRLHDRLDFGKWGTSAGGFVEGCNAKFLGIAA
jgi:hypothetical protein